MAMTNYLIIEDQRIPLRDGVTLSARVWMPSKRQVFPLPAILEVLPYRKRDGTAARDATTHNLFAENGYACLRVDLRGTGDSGGLFDDEYSERELDDIEDIIAWTAAEPWCSGAVGMMGISWGGINGLQMAARRPEALKAVISTAAVVDRFADDIHYKGGCELGENVGWAARAMSILSLPPDPIIVGENWRDIWLHRLANTAFLPGIWARHRTRNAYWRRGSVCEDFDKITIPILSIAGLKDGYRNLPIKMLEGLEGDSKAILGPWDHNYPHISSYGPWLNFPAEALRWWDRWLKGEENGVDTNPALRAFIIDGTGRDLEAPIVSGHWVSVQNWPSDATRNVNYFLDDTGLTSEPGTVNQTITTELLCGAASGEFFSTQQYSLDHPSEQAPDDLRSLVFDSAAAPDDTVFLGAPKAEFRLASNKTCGQIVARLCDVSPDGSSRLISIGMLNMTFRNGSEAPEPLQPGESYLCKVEFDHVGYRLPAGHRLRLALSTSYWPYCWPEAEDFSLQVQEGRLFLPEFNGNQSVTVDELSERVDQTTFVRPLKDKFRHKSRFREDGRWVLEVVSDDGGIEIEEHELKRFSSVHEKWSIDPTDASSPSVDIEWMNSIARNDFQAGTLFKTSMRTDADFIHIEGNLEACEAGTRVFQRAFSEKIPRALSSNGKKPKK